MQLRLQELMKEMKGSQLQEQTLLHQEALREYARQMRDMDRTVALQSRVHHEQMMAAHKQMQAANHQIQVVRKKHEAFKDALKSELIRDGYLDKDEPLRSIRWTNDDMEVNGMKVKPKDAKKYRKLNKKFLGESSVIPTVAYFHITPNPGSSRHDITPTESLNPPVTMSVERSKLPSRSMYRVWAHANAVCSAAEMLIILSSLHPQKRSTPAAVAMSAILRACDMPPHFINLI